MPPLFTGTIPKNYNEHLFVDFGTIDTPDWQEFCKGITSRGVDISEDTEEYYDFCGRGSPDTDVTTQTVTRNYTGYRALGDPAQDHVFLDLLYNLDLRNVRYIRYYDNPPTSWTTPTPRGNGWQGNGKITIADDGSGDATARQNIDFSILEEGYPTRGTVAVDPDTNIPTFTPLAP